MADALQVNSNLKFLRCVAPPRATPAALMCVARGSGVDLGTAEMLAHLRLPAELAGERNRFIIERLDRHRLPLILAAARGDLSEMQRLLDRGEPINGATRYRTTALSVALDEGHEDAAVLLGDVNLWQSDLGMATLPARLSGPFPPVPIRKEWVRLRQLRDLLRPLVDPRVQTRRAMIFRDSPLLVLPWHLRVLVLRFLVHAPIWREWGDDEFRRWHSRTLLSYRENRR